MPCCIDFIFLGVSGFNHLTAHLDHENDPLMTNQLGVGSVNRRQWRLTSDLLDVPDHNLQTSTLVSPFSCRAHQKAMFCHSLLVAHQDFWCWGLRDKVLLMYLQFRAISIIFKWTDDVVQCPFAKQRCQDGQWMRFEWRTQPQSIFP